MSEVDQALTGEVPVVTDSDDGILDVPGEWDAGDGDVADDAAPAQEETIPETPVEPPADEEEDLTGFVMPEHFKGLPPEKLAKSIVDLQRKYTEKSMELAAMQRYQLEQQQTAQEPAQDTAQHAAPAFTPEVAKAREIYFEEVASRKKEYVMDGRLAEDDDLPQEMRDFIWNRSYSQAAKEVAEEQRLSAITQYLAPTIIGNDIKSLYAPVALTGVTEEEVTNAITGLIQQSGVTLEQWAAEPVEGKRQFVQRIANDMFVQKFQAGQIVPAPVQRGQAPPQAAPGVRGNGTVPAATAAVMSPTIRRNLAIMKQSFPDLSDEQLLSIMK